MEAEIYRLSVYASGNWLRTLCRTVEKIRVPRIRSWLYIIYQHHDASAIHPHLSVTPTSRSIIFIWPDTRRGSDGPATILPRYDVIHPKTKLGRYRRTGRDMDREGAEKVWGEGNLKAREGVTSVLGQDKSMRRRREDVGGYILAESVNGARQGLGDISSIQARITPTNAVACVDPCQDGWPYWGFHRLQMMFPQAGDGQCPYHIVCGWMSRIMEDELYGVEVSCMMYRWVIWCEGELYGVKVSCMVWRWVVWCIGELYGVVSYMVLRWVVWCIGELYGVEVISIVWWWVI